MGRKISMVKKLEAPRGYVPMLVGRGKEMERFMVHTKLLNHPYIGLLLDMAAEEYGYKQQGILRIPCDLEHFRRVVHVVAKARL